MSDRDKPAFDANAYWNKRYATIDATKSGHIDLPVEYNAWLYRRKQDHFAKAVQCVGGSLRGNKLLEVAAGSGAWLDFWRTQGVGDYLGIDLSERAVEGLRKNHPALRFLQRDLNDADLAAVVGGGYDCVAAIDVLYHVLDDARFRALIGELSGVLKPGGWLVIHDQFLHGAAFDHGQYIRWRTLEDYQHALTNAGFDIVYRRPTFFFMIQSIDFSGRAAALMRMLWERISYPLIAHLPRVAGFIGYALDSAVCAILREGPSMEIMICRKRT